MSFQIASNVFVRKLEPADSKFSPRIFVLVRNKSNTTAQLCRNLEIRWKYRWPTLNLTFPVLYI